jgi:hypothetical protein
VIQDELLRAAQEVHADAAGRDGSLRDVPLLAIALATVDRERMTGAIDPPGEWRPVERDAWLGAAAWRRTAVGGERPLLLVLEPDTEGRLAAFLARWGEAVAAIYLLVPEKPEAGARETRAVRPGPLGPARLVPGVPGVPDWGPHVLLLERNPEPLAGPDPGPPPPGRSSGIA